MISFDTNVAFHAFNEDSPHHADAIGWVSSLPVDSTVVISEFVLVEFYRLLRNPAVLNRPLSAERAADVIASYRSHQHWRLVGFPASSRSLHDALWQKARSPDFAIRRIFDVRVALTLQAHGVREFATVNVKDFRDLGFERVWNPLSP